MRRSIISAGGAAVGAAMVLAGHALSPTVGTAEPGAVDGRSPDATRRRLVNGTATGPLVETRYGPVRVRVTVAAGAITDVVTLSLPTEHAHSRWIGENLVPQLRQRVLSAQSADVDVVSGATYTSGGYLTSLQGALDQLA